MTRYLLYLGLLLFSNQGVSQPLTWAEKVFRGLSLEEKIGQLFWVRCPTKFHRDKGEAVKNLAALAKEGKIGGLVLFKGSIYSSIAYMSYLQSLSRIPMIVSADMEYGMAMRVKEGTEFPVAMALSATRNPQFSYDMGRIIAREALSLGIHVNFAPVLDINNNPNNPVINTRSYGENIELINTIAGSYIRGLQDHGMVSTIKHFPGHGNVDVDSHKDLPVLPFSLDDLRKVELRTFKAAIDSGAMAVMIGHLAVPKITSSESLPATLSPDIIKKILRDELGFSGLVITDALDMLAIKKYVSEKEVPILALEAGCDVLLMPENVDAAHASIVEAVISNRLSEEVIDRAVMNILRAKEKLAIKNMDLSVLLEGVFDDVAADDAQRLAKVIADESVTLLKNQENLFPIRQEKRILNISLQNTTTCGIGEKFAKSLKQKLPSRHFQYVRIDDETYSEVYQAALKKAMKQDIVIISTYVESRSSSGHLKLKSRQHTFLKELLEKLEEKDIKSALIVFGTPYIVSSYDRANAIICAYQSAKVSENAVAKVIAGDIVPKGKLPISISSEFKFGDGITNY